jgi:predicted Fe-Mo cluster-binding NifX family protein
MAIIAIPSSNKGGLNEIFDPRFGRCESITFITIEGKEIKEVKAVENPAAAAMGGAGIKATEVIGNNGASTVIVGHLGPNAAQSLNTLKVEILQQSNMNATVKETLESYLKGNLNPISEANVSPHYGMGRSGQGVQRRFQGGR